MTGINVETPVVLQHAGVGTDGDQYPKSTPSADVALLDSLPREQQELAVTLMLDQSKQWLDRAMQATNPARAVSDFKAFIATVSEASKQKKLSEGIQLDATEMVRRAERALGVAIREGQEAGTIARRGQGGGTQFPPNANRPRADYEMSLPSEYARKDELPNAGLRGTASLGSWWKDAA